MKLGRRALPPAVAHLVVVRRRIMFVSKTGRLQEALGDVIVFLRSARCDRWVALLAEIERKLSDSSTVEVGRRELDNCFGAMGSLNDLCFCEENGNLPLGADPGAANQDFSHLLDILFRENRLVTQSFIQRLLWHYYAYTHRAELPPRIKKAFSP